MSKLVLSGDTSGSVTLDAPAVSGTTTLTLPNTSGTLVVTSGAQTIEFADGSASTPSITNSGDTNTGIFFPAADTIAFAEGGTEVMRIASDGTVTISKGVSGTPAFAAYQSTGVALTAATFTKITFQTEEYDTNSNFASSRFTPTVAGYYQINGAWQFGSGGTVTVCAIYKNGTIYKQGTAVGGTAGYGGAVSSLVYCNGSSDYVELYGYASTAKTPLATIDATYFNGALVRGA